MKEFLSSEIIGTTILVVALILALLISKRLINQFSKLKTIDANRRRIILNLNYIGLYAIAAVVATIIWGVDMKQFTVFISSILAVLGVGFFAQWSILSNLTASVILFFSHPVRIGDKISVQDKDFNWTGEVKDITGFFLFMRTENDENITIPTNLVLQKGIQILNKEIEEEYFID
ncbi:MAG: mechanosensitive ion channel [Flavobacteriaceae bacterium]|nr:mechanosensitive ion channel [Flavobacteriaceae bacterium]